MSLVDLLDPSSNALAKLDRIELTVTEHKSNMETLILPVGGCDATVPSSDNTPAPLPNASQRPRSIVYDALDIITMPQITMYVFLRTLGYFIQLESFIQDTILHTSQCLRRGCLGDRHKEQSHQ